MTRPLRVLLLDRNQLSLNENSLLKLHWLGKLDISYNSLKFLPAETFKDLKNLFELNLSNNLIEFFNENVFLGLGSLKKLDLSGNNLAGLRKETFIPLKVIHHLTLKDNQLQDVTEDTFDTVPTLRILHTDAYKFCCIASQVEECTPEADEFSSCQDLMANPTLQISIWVLGLVATFGNIFVIIWRVISDRHRISSFYILNLGCSDLLMGVYLLIIASVDLSYRGVYIVYAESWRSSGLCKLAGIIAMLSSELSVFMLTVITADRVLSIMFPFKVSYCGRAA